MIEGELANYGVFGLWTMFNIGLIGYFLRKEQANRDRLIKVIENNTEMMTRVQEAVDSCRFNRR